MEIRYKREPNSSHMIVEDIPESNSFEDRMISENDIPCLLNFGKAGSNGYYSYWFDISAKKSMKSYFSQEGITPESVYECFKGILDGINSIGKYLLSTGNLLIGPETVFFRNDGMGWRVFMAYVPGLDEKFDKGILSIAEYLIQNVNHENHDAVKCCYSIYEKAVRGDFILSELLDFARKPLDEVCDNTQERNMFRPEYQEFNTDENVFKESLVDDKGENIPWLGSPDSIFGKEEDLFEPQEEKKRAFFSLKKKGVKSRKKKFKQKEENIRFEDFITDPSEEGASISFATTVMEGGEANFHHRLIYEGRGGHRDFELDKTPFLIGSRENGNDGVIKEAVVSRNHARIIIKENEYYLEDLESRNGTFLNGQILDFNKQAKLTSGDRISFANIGYKFM